MHRLLEHIHAVVAISFREIMARYGRNNLGFVWAIIEPMILCTGVLILQSSLRAPYEKGLPFLAIILTGYMPLTLWRHLTNSSVQLFHRNYSLLYHRSIKLWDVFAAKMTVEFVTTSAAGLILYFVLLGLGFIEPVHYLDPFVGGWLLMGYLSVCFGAMLASLTAMYPELERFVQVFQYLLLPVSGFIFLMEWFPEHIQNLFLLNPMAHCFELLRSGFFGERMTAHYSVSYVIICGLCFAMTAVFLSPSVRERLDSA